MKIRWKNIKHLNDDADASIGQLFKDNGLAALLLGTIYASLDYIINKYTQHYIVPKKVMLLEIIFCTFAVALFPKIALTIKNLAAIKDGIAIKKNKLIFRSQKIRIYLFNKRNDFDKPLIFIVMFSLMSGMLLIAHCLQAFMLYTAIVLGTALLIRATYPFKPLAYLLDFLLIPQDKVTFIANNERKNYTGFCTTIADCKYLHEKVLPFKEQSINTYIINIGAGLFAKVPATAIVKIVEDYKS